MEAPAPRHPVDLACGVALGAVVVIDLFTASALSLVAYVQPSVVGLVQFLETRLSQINLVCALSVLVTWPFLFGEAHRRLTLGVVTLQTLGLILDVISLVVSTIFGHQANPLYLLLEAACVHVSVVLLFAVWYTTLDHPRKMQAASGAPARSWLIFPQNNVRYHGYENWVPGFIDYSSCPSACRARWAQVTPYPSLGR